MFPKAYTLLVIDDVHANTDSRFAGNSTTIAGGGLLGRSEEDDVATFSRELELELKSKFFSMIKIVKKTIMINVDVAVKNTIVGIRRKSARRTHNL
jgi:hypothetical protein